MIEEKEILVQLKKLPDEFKLEVMHYVEFLQTKLNASKPRLKRKAGSAKGKYKLTPDFDAPLKDFEEYT